jgi:Carboxypeptidase regulatory-like domain
VKLFWAALIMALVMQVAPTSGSISGVVIKAGTAIRQPLRNARLELTGNSVGSALVARTDGNGEFLLSSLQPGQYTLDVTCDGFIRQQFPKKIVLARGQPAPRVTFEMDPAPTAAGWVLDTNGEPITNVEVEALRRTYDARGNARLARAATGITDDRGQYRIFWLDPGEYFFYASSPLPSANDTQSTAAVTPTYFPGVNTADDAKPLRLDVGREVRVDFRLRHAALWSVSGHAMGDTSGRPLTASITLTPPAEDPSFSRYHAQSSAAGLFPGQFAMDNVSPGSYILVARSGSTGQEITSFQRVEIRAVEVAPVGGYSVTLALSPPLSLLGGLFVESREAVDLRRAIVSLISADPDMPSPPSVVPVSGNAFSVNGIIPGSYVVEVSNLPQDLYLKAARFGDDDVLEKPLMPGRRQVQPPLQILLGSDGGRLQVAAYNAKGELQSSAHFVLVPDASRRYRRELYRIATSGEDGQATLRGIAPGNYKLFAWEDLQAYAYLNSMFMEQYESSGVPVKIVPGDNPPAAARMIPKLIQ